MTQYHVSIHGHVQGVFFRASAQEKALELGLTGWVMNTENGTVEVLIQGNDDLCQKMIKWCHEGPPGATVTNVTYDATNREECHTFQIRYS